MKICYLLHGIKTRDPERSSISFLRYIMPRFKVIALSYGNWPVLFAILMPIVNHFVVKAFVRQIRPGQILIGHSNGCTVAYGISQKLYTKGLVLINPALNSDVEFDPFLEFIHIYWSPNDRVTWLSRLMPFSLWGAMGTIGYTGADARVRQFKMCTKHTSIGDAEVAVRWGPIIVKNIEDAVKSPSV